MLFSDEVAEREFLDIMDRMAIAWEQIAAPPDIPVDPEQVEFEKLMRLQQTRQIQKELARDDEFDAELELLEKKLQKVYKRRELKMMRDEGFVEDSAETDALIEGTWKPPE